MNSNLLLLILVTSLTVDGVPDVTLRMTGDVTLGVLWQTQLWQGQRCGDRQPGYVEDVEAIRWFVNLLNQRDFIPGVSIGLEVLETCGNEEKATRQLLELLDSHSPQSNSSLIGILGPSLSSETAYVTRVLGSLPSSERPPVISATATAARLTADAAEAGNFFRVISPDSVQVAVMVELMKSLSWNYVAVVYEDLLYGREGATSLRDMLRASGTACVAVFESIPPSGDSVIGKIRSIVTKVKTLQIAGVVLFASTDTTKDVFTVAQDERLTSVTFILSEAVFGSQSDLRNKNKAEGSLFTSPAYYPHSGFAEHWRQVTTNQTARNLASSDNPFLANVDLTTVKGMEQSVYAHYAMTGVLVLADAFKRLHSAKCSGPGLCDGLRRAGLQELVDQVRRINLSGDESRQYLENNATLTFNSAGEAVLSPPVDHPLYQVFRLRENRLVKVGDYQPGRLTLGGAESQNLPQPAQCPEGRNCSSCLTSDLADAVFVVPGEHYIVVVVPIHEEKKGEPLMCGNFLPKISVDLAEAANFAVSMLNQRRDSRFQSRLSGSLGLLVINSCNSPLVLEQRLLALHSGTLPLGNGRNSAELASKIVGYVGALGTALSLPMATVLDRLGFVQISYASTGVSLSDREKYRYFMRLVTPDDQQAEAILSLVSKLGSNYIQIIYSKEAYGQGGRDAILAKASSHSVCVANQIEVEDTQESYNSIKNKLLKFPLAKLVVLFLRTHMVTQVLQTLQSGNVLNQFSWLGSETWGRRSDLLSIPGTEGAITLVQEAPLLPELETHIRGQNLTLTSDPWLRKYVEERLGCHLPGSFNRHLGTACAQDAWSRFPSDQFIQDAWAPYLVYGVYALALGWDQALREECANSRDSLPCPRLTPARLVQHVKQVRLDLQVRGQADKLFDDNGDGTGGYGVVQVVRRDGRLIYTERGSWKKATKLTTPLTTRVDSTCPNAIACQHCFSGTSSPAPPGGTSAPMTLVAGLGGAAGFLLLVCVVCVVCLVRAKRNAPEDCSSPYDSPSPFEDPLPPRCGCGSASSHGSSGQYLSPKFEISYDRPVRPMDSELELEPYSTLNEAQNSI